MPINPSPGGRQWVKTYPTPKIADTLFYETETYEERASAPEYGTAHKNATRFPNHAVCFIEPIEGQGKLFKVWYCADRESQEDYNADISYPFGGAIQYPRVTRTYILPRDDCGPIQTGTEDPGGPAAGTFNYLRPGGVDGYRRPDTTSTYVRPDAITPILIAQSRKEIGGTIGSLYVEVTRIFDAVPGTDDAVEGSGAGQITFGYQVDRPFGDDRWLLLTWKLVLPREIADANRQADYATCPISGYTNLVLIDETITALADNDQESEIVRIYEGNATGAAFPSGAGTVLISKTYPGGMPPQKFVESVKRYEYRIPIQRTTDFNFATNANVEDPNTAFYVEADEAIPDQKSGMLRGTNKLSTLQEISLRTLSGSEWDKNLMAYVPYTVRCLTTAEAAALAAAEIGTMRTLTPYNIGWVIETVERPVEVTIAQATPFHTSHPASWPKVLLPFVMGATTNNDVGIITVRPSPGEDPDTAENTGVLFTQFEFKPEWTGICKAIRRIGWSKTAPQFSAIEALDTTGLRFFWPGVTRNPVVIEECLHGPTNASAYVFRGSVGNNHPVYGPVAYTKTWANTTYLDWPDSLIVEYDVQPYKGGYLIRQLTVLKPY
jgi:hypothetical protein